MRIKISSLYFSLILQLMGWIDDDLSWKEKEKHLDNVETEKCEHIQSKLTYSAVYWLLSFEIAMYI